MAILFYFLLVLINCQINFGNHHKIIKDDCNDDIENVVGGQIKYLSIIHFFYQDYNEDLKYYNIFFQQQVKQKIELKNSLKMFDKLQMIKKDIAVQSYIKNIDDNNHPHDYRVEQAYKQLFKIGKFLNAFNAGVKFLNYEKAQIDLDTPHKDLFRIIIRHLSQIRILEKLNQLKQDYFTCKDHDFPIDLIQLNQNSYLQEQINPLSISNLENNLMTQQTSEFQGYNLQDFETQIQKVDCNQKLPQIQSLLMEFQKLSELIEFKSTFKTHVFQQLLDYQEELIIDSIPIKEYIKGVQINEKIQSRYDILHELLTDQQVSKIFKNELSFELKQELNMKHLSNYSIYDVFYSRLRIYKQLLNYEVLMDDSLYFFSFFKQNYKQLQQTFESLKSYIQHFEYSQEYIQKGINYFQRDILICTAKLKDKNQLQYGISNQKESCQQKLQNIEQKIYQYQQANELSRLQQQTHHYDSIFHEIEDSDKKIFSIIKNLQKYWKILENSEILYYIQIYPTHNDPEDQESVQAYYNLIKLQYLLVYLLNAFSQAEEFLEFNIKNINSYSKQYQNAKLHDKVYQKKYSDRKVRDQLKILSQDYEQCSDNQQMFADHNQIFDTDNSMQDYYYWVNKKIIQKNPKNLLILPIIVDQFEKEDISNYEELSLKCQSDIEGIFEDIIETLKIIELLKYRQQGQIQFNTMIFQAFNFKKEFLNQTKQLYLAMEEINLPQKLRFFRFIEGQSIDEDLQNKFNNLHSFNNNLGYFAYAFMNSIDLLKFKEEDFNQMEENQLLLNNYLKDFQKYQLIDKQNELLSLYNQYKTCSGQEFLYDFCKSYEQQNIFGGICQNSCYESQKFTMIHSDIKIENKNKHKNIQKLHSQMKYSKKQQKKNQ